MVHQMSIASAPYERGIDEFEKSGLTKLTSIKVFPPGVAESPFVMEAKLIQHIDFGKKPGSANLLICEIILFHVNTDLLNDSYILDIHKMDHVARMGGSWYTRASDGLFELRQPTAVMHGYDSLPESIKLSTILTSSDIHNLLSFGIPQQATTYKSDPVTESMRHLHAKQLISEGKISEAWDILLQ